MTDGGTTDGNSRSGHTLASAIPPSEMRRRAGDLVMPRTLGLDFGLRRVGAALSDPRRLIATPLEVYQRQSEPVDARHYRRLVGDEDVDRLVVGLPLHTGGGASDLSRAARAWGRWLSESVARPVVFFDERYTTVEADELMRAHELKTRDRKAMRDKVAAQILLQNYLDSGSPDADSGAAPLMDDGPAT